MELVHSLYVMLLGISGTGYNAPGGKQEVVVTPGSASKLCH